MHIELYIPGLLGAPARFEERLKLPELPALQTWLARAGARQAAGAGRHAAFAAWLGVEKAPLAALHWLAETGQRPEHEMLLAQPVSLQAGIDDLVLLAADWLKPDAAELRALNDALAAHFDEILLAGASLFVQLPGDAAVRTRAPYLLQGRRIGRHLPQGDTALRWHAWMNEAQMLLHTLAFNEQRRGTGRMPLNGIWLWGEGSLPETTDIAGTVYARTPFMRGFAVLTGTDAIETPASLDAVSASDETLFVEVDDAARCLDADDADAWIANLNRIEQDWLAPVLAQLREGKLQSACLYGGDGFAYVLSRKDLGKFWRRGVFARYRPQLHFEE